MTSKVFSRKQSAGTYILRVRGTRSTSEFRTAVRVLRALGASVTCCCCCCCHGTPSSYGVYTREYEVYWEHLSSAVADLVGTAVPGTYGSINRLPIVSIAQQKHDMHVPGIR